MFTDLFAVQHDAESVPKTEPGSTVAFDELGGNCVLVYIRHYMLHMGACGSTVG